MRVEDNMATEIVRSISEDDPEWEASSFGLRNSVLSIEISEYGRYSLFPSAIYVHFAFCRPSIELKGRDCRRVRRAMRLWERRFKAKTRRIIRDAITHAFTNRRAVAAEERLHAS